MWPTYLFRLSRYAYFLVRVRLLRRLLGGEQCLQHQAPGHGSGAATELRPLTRRDVTVHYIFKNTPHLTLLM